MMLSKNIIKFDFYAIKRNLLLVLIPVSIIVLLFVFFVFTFKNNQLLVPVYDKNNLLQYYQTRLNQCLESLDSTVNYNDRNWLLEQIAYYRFYISTGTVEWNYIGLRSLSSYAEGYDGTSFAMYVIDYLKYFYYLFTPFVFVYFINNNHGLSYKNILMSKEKRNVVFQSRVFSAFVFTLISFLIPLTVLTICVFSTPSLNVLFYFNSSMYSIHPYLIFLTKSLAILTISYILAFIAVFSAFIIKKWQFGYITAPVIYVIMLTISQLMGTLLYNNLGVSYDNGRVFPFDSLENLSNYGFTWQYAICILMHIAIGVLLYYLSKRKFERKDF